MATRKLQSSLPVPEAVKFEGNLLENWNYFSTQWKNYAIATGLKGESEEIQVATFLVLIGKQCYDVYQHLPLSEDQKKSLSSIVEALESYFKPRCNVTYERYVFNTCDQEPRQSISDYVLLLRKLSSSCAFGAMEEELLKDRLVLGVYNKALQARLLQESDLNLQRAIAMCRNKEQTDKQLEQIAKSSASCENVFATGPKHQERINFNRRQWKCQSCGRSTCKGRKNCSAFGATCFKCGKSNHFANVCRATNIRSIMSENSFSESDETVQHIEHCYNAVEKSGKQWFVTLLSKVKDNRPLNIKFQLDSGSTCNTISLKLFRQLVNGNLKYLDKSAKKLRLYGGAMIFPRGQCIVTCERGGKEHPLLFQIIDKDINPLLSAESCELLRLITFNVHEDPLMRCCNKIDSYDSLMTDYADVFEGLGSIPGAYHIEVDPDVPPVQHRPRRVPIAMKAQLKTQLDELTEKKIVAPVTKPTDWISSMVVVKRPNKLRLCLDPKDLNKAIKRPHYPVPTIDEILPELTNAKVFSVVDASNGFWQVVLDESSSYLTTFWTPFGRYRWLRMPFGISSAPEEFQRRLHEITHGMTGVNVIADDILVYGCGSTRAEAMIDHDRNFTTLLNKAREVNLKFNKEKLKFRVSTVRYMGHLLTSEGLKPDPSKVEAIKLMPKPQNVKSVQSLLGFANYLSRFMPKLSETCEPLRRLTDKKVEFKWEDVHENAFNSIKKLVTEAPVLKYYNVEKDVEIECDASLVGLGAVLLQDGQPVAYASRSLSTTEQRYAQIEKECLAIVFACEKFDQFIMGKPEVKVFSDHKPLETIFKKPLLSAPKRLQRMLLRLQRYSLEVVYKQGKLQHVADFLSRASLPNVNNEVSNRDNIFRQIETINASEDILVTDKSLQEIQYETAEDNDLQQLMKIIENGWPVSKGKCSQATRPYWNFRDELISQDGIIYKGQKVVIPKQLHQKMVERIHYCHMGSESCLRRARETLFWLGMSSQVKEFISKCSICNSFLSKQQKEPLMCYEVPEKPWSQVAIDLFSYDNKNFIVLVDYFSDFWEVKKLTKVTAEPVINFCKEQFARHGIPSRIISDNGPPFGSEQFRNFAKAWNFEHVTSSPWHSQSNGKAESAVKIAKNLIKKSLTDDRDIWLCLLDWRNTPTQGINSSPVQRLMSRRTRTLLPTSTALLQPTVVENVKEDILKRRAISKRNFDRHSKVQRELAPGETVRVEPLHRQAKWLLGFCVRKVAPRSYLINIDGKLYRRNRRFLRPVNETVPCSSFPSSNEFKLPDTPASPLTTFEDRVSDSPDVIAEEAFAASPNNTETVPRKTRNVGPPKRFGFDEYVTNN